MLMEFYAIWLVSGAYYKNYFLDAVYVFNDVLDALTVISSSELNGMVTDFYLSDLEIMFPSQKNKRFIFYTIPRSRFHDKLIYELCDLKLGYPLSLMMH